MAREEPGIAAVKLSELVDAFEFVSVSGFEENRAYVCRKTGRVFWVSDVVDMDEEELPEDLDESDQYEAVPHRRELDLGKKLALSFVANELPAELPAARGIFSRKGAYGRFRRLLEVNGHLDKWYAFEERAVEAALKDWCEDVGIMLIGE